MERIKNILISPELTIKQTLKKMDMSGKNLLIVVDKNNKLLGIVSDGDIRRWILKGKELTDPVTKAMNPNPVVFNEDYSRDEVKKLMLDKKIQWVPIIRNDRTIASVVWWVDLFEEEQETYGKIDAPVVIMAGGKGKRLSPLTHVIPKPLMPIGEKAIIEVIMDQFEAHGCKDFYLSVNYKANLIKAYFADIKTKKHIRYIEEKQPLGTAGSLYLLKNKIKKTFFVNNCDIFIKTDYLGIFKFHKANKNKITVIACMKHYTIPYGICNISEGGLLKNINEKPEYDYLVNTGMYLLEPSCIKDIPENKFCHITDLINQYMKEGKKVGVYPVSEKSWLDMGQWEEYQSMLSEFESIAGE